jgi:hypothetical protein
VEGLHPTGPVAGRLQSQVMVTRIAFVALVGVAALLAGCAKTAPAPKATISDEDQIVNVVARAAKAHVSQDSAGIASSTCAKYRDQAGAPTPVEVPPMNALPLDAFSTMTPDQLAEALGKEYTGASAEAVRALAEALISRDEAAYTEAMADVMTQTMQVRVDKVENLEIDGDTATVEATLVISTGGQVSYTQDGSQFTLVKEDGQWKDCTPPGQ